MIYNYGEASLQFTKGVGHRKLSLAKQRTIAGSNEPLYLLKIAVEKQCGYCFKYMVNHKCYACPLFKKLGMPCYKIPEWGMIMDARNIEDFRTCHLAWCHKLGLMI